MTVILVEDEKPALDKLKQMVSAFSSNVEVVAELVSVKQAVAWLKNNEHPDLGFFDIQLSDGLSLEIFDQCLINFPIIFTTAFDNYMVQAFELNGIDYLLKPIKKEQLENSLRKYHRLQEHFQLNVSSLLNFLNGKASRNRFTSGDNQAGPIVDGKKKYKERLTVRRGLEYVSILCEDISYFFTEHKLVFLIDDAGQKFIIDKVLLDLEDELNPDAFFRINRKYLVNITAISHYKSHYKGKLVVELKPKANEAIIVSQEKAASFKSWMEK